MVTFLQVKTSERMTNKSFDAMLAAFRKSFPDASELPHTYSKMENFLRAVGIGYDMIHVCKNNCVLFRKDYANLSECPKCKSLRWKDGDVVKRIPHNVLRIFQLYQDCRGCFMMLKQERMYCGILGIRSTEIRM